MNKSFLFIILFFFGVALLVHCLENNPHDFKESECVICHQGDPSSPVSTAGPQSQTCVNCHRDVYESGYMHPVNVIPEHVEIPADMPLSRSGFITCNTCHNVHSGNKTGFGERTYFLRRLERGRAFCVACHTENDLTGTTGHAEFLGEAHFQSKYISTGSGQEIDAMSKNCITCHDGTYGSAVTINSGNWQHSSQYASDRMGRKHPIGVDYEMARQQYGQKTDLRPIFLVDKRIQFFNGTVGCGSCHNPYSQHDTKLVMSNRRSALCFACHALD
jgi:predicted CXXCH cytochrome family protein